MSRKIKLIVDRKRHTPGRVVRRRKKAVRRLAGRTQTKIRTRHTLVCPSWTIFVTDRPLGLQIQIDDEKRRCWRNVADAADSESCKNSDRLGSISATANLSSRSILYMKNHPFMQIEPPWKIMAESRICRVISGDQINHTPIRSEKCNNVAYAGSIANYTVDLHKR